MIVLMPHCGFLSETSRMLAIRAALRRRGVATTVATHGGPYERLIREAGVAYERIEPAMDHARCATFLQQLPGISNHRGSVLTDEEIRQSATREAELFRDTGARAAVTGFTLSALLSTRLAGIPLVTEHAGSYVPPVFERGLLPAPSRAQIPLTSWLPESARRWLANKGPTRVKGYCAGFNRVAAELGVEPIPSLAALLLGDLTLVTDVPEVTGVPAEDLERWTPREPKAYRRSPALRYVGPLFARFDLPIPEHVERLLGSSGPKVYVALTSAPAPLVRGVVERVREAGVKVVVASTIHELSDLASDDVAVADVLPSHLVFPRVDLGVVAGGQGSVQTAMAAGVPVVGIPLQPEQDWNVAAVSRLGAALRATPAEAVTSVMTTKVRELLEKPDARAAAGRIREVFSGIDGAERSADVIVEWLDRRTASAA
jgi:UDP:flavonoid glycosyltransferase YjiC (YdhE family)